MSAHERRSAARLIDERPWRARAAVQYGAVKGPHAARPPRMCPPHAQAALWSTCAKDLDMLTGTGAAHGHGPVGMPRARADADDDRPRDHAHDLGHDQGRDHDQAQAQAHDRGEYSLWGPPVVQHAPPAVNTVDADADADADARERDAYVRDLVSYEVRGPSLSLSLPPSEPAHRVHGGHRRCGIGSRRRRCRCWRAHGAR